MSENKYIIDKDSLTGIADAVRDKLGTGEATTDETTGDIIYPEDKGYYLKQEKLAGFIYPNTSSSHWTHDELMSVSHETILELCGNINPSFIKFTVLTKGDSYSSYSTASQTLYNGVYFYSGEITNSTTLLNNVVGATKTFAYTGQGCYITGAWGSYSTGGWNPNHYSFYSFPGVLQIEFLNENQQNIEAAINGPIAGTSRYTMEIPDGEKIPIKIPFSIDDIQDKITNYLSKGGSSFEYPIPTQTLTSGSGAWSLNLESTFSSVEDFKNRFLQASANMGTGYQAFYLVCGKDGKPASMKELGITLRSDIQRYLGSWDMNDVRTSYENDLVFPLIWLNSPVDKNTFWLYVTSDAKNMVFCMHNYVGYQLSSSGYLYVAYKGA